MSKQPRKQRTRTERAPLHQRHKQVRAPLSEELRDEYETRTVRVNVGDTVEVTRGDYAGHEDEVVKVDLIDSVVHVDGVTVERADGEEVARPLDASNVRITDLDLSDDIREERIESFGDDADEEDETEEDGA